MGAKHLLTSSTDPDPNRLLQFRDGAWHPLGDMRFATMATTEVRGHQTGGCGITLGGDVACWGLPSLFQHAQSDAGFNPANFATPVKVYGVADATDVAVELTLACAININQELYCWGIGLVPWQLGPFKPPFFVMAGVTRVSLGGDHGCVVTAARQVWCWGFNTNGEAVPDYADSSVPVPTLISNLANVVEVAASMGRTCARRFDGGRRLLKQ